MAYRFLVVCLLVALMSACGQPSRRVEALMGGADQAKLIAQATKATAFRIKLDPNDGFTETVISEGVELTDVQRNTLAKLLLSDSSYSWDIVKKCAPMPGVLVVFGSGENKSEVRLCYECSMLGFTPGDWEDFDPIRQELVKWAKPVFPDDAVIQGL